MLIASHFTAARNIRKLGRWGEGGSYWKKAEKFRNK